MRQKMSQPRSRDGELAAADRKSRTSPRTSREYRPRAGGPRIAVPSLRRANRGTSCAGRLRVRIETPITDCFGNMRCAHVRTLREVGDRARHLEHAVIGPRGERKAAHRLHEQTLPFAIRRAVETDLGHYEARVWSSLARFLPFMCRGDTLADARRGLASRR